jgi:hypothetical protein
MKLTLKTERLAELTTDDLHRVVGAQAIPTLDRYCLTVLCPSNPCTTAQSCGCEPTWNCA